MPQIAPIVLADGQPTPVNHTFSPAGVTNAGVYVFEDRVTGIPVGYNKLSVSLRQPSVQSRNYKVAVKLSVASLEVTSPNTSTGIQPAPTKAYDCTAFVEFVLPERSTLQNRKDLAVFLKNAMSDAGVIQTVVQQLESFY